MDHVTLTRRNRTDHSLIEYAAVRSNAEFVALLFAPVWRYNSSVREYLEWEGAEGPQSALVIKR